MAAALLVSTVVLALLDHLAGICRLDVLEREKCFSKSFPHQMVGKGGGVRVNVLYRCCRLVREGIEIRERLSILFNWQSSTTSECARPQKPSTRTKISQGSVPPTNPRSCDSTSRGTGQARSRAQIFWRCGSPPKEVLSHTIATSEDCLGRQ